MQAMTAAEFLAYWLTPDEEGRSLLDYQQESLGEHEAQYRSECAAFGDAGPGQGLRVSEMKRELASVQARIAKLGGR
jgi:hypothetical protein